MANSDDCRFRKERVSALAEMLISNYCGPFMQKMALKLPGVRVRATQRSDFALLQ